MGCVPLIFVGGCLGGVNLDLRSTLHNSMAKAFGILLCPAHSSRRLHCISLAFEDWIGFQQTRYLFSYSMRMRCGAVRCGSYGPLLRGIQSNGSSLGWDRIEILIWYGPAVKSLCLRNQRYSDYVAGGFVCQRSKLRHFILGAKSFVIDKKLRFLPWMRCGTAR